MLEMKRMMRGAWFGVWIAAFAMVGCDDADPVDPGGDDVEIITLTSNLTFSRSNLTIEPGTTVRWVNGASIGHTVTPDGHSEWARWATDSQGQTFEHTFDAPGTFAYFCEPHQAVGMTGVITVQ